MAQVKPLKYASGALTEVDTTADDVTFSTLTGTNGVTSTGGASLTGGVLTLTGNDASSLTTSSGALTITSAAAATWSTAAGLLTLDGAGGFSLDGNAGDCAIATTGLLNVDGDVVTIDSSSSMTLTSQDVLDIDGAGGPVSINSLFTINIGNDANAQPINIGTGAAARTVTIGNSTGATAVDIDAGTGGVNVTGVAAFANDVTINANLTVTGTTFTTESETVLIADNHLYLNDGYTTAVAQTGGLVVNYLPTATTDTVAATGFTAGVPATSNPTVITAGSATFGVGDLIQISGANDPANDGLFEVLTHTGTTLTIRGIGTSATLQDFTQNQFVTDTTVAGSIYKVNVSVIRSGTDGAWEVGSGSTNGLTFADLGTTTGGTLQAAYEAGNTITTDVTNGDFDVSGTEAISLDAGKASNFSVTGAGIDLTLSSAAGRVVVDGGEAAADAVRIVASTAGGGIDIDANSGGATLTSTGGVDIASSGGICKMHSTSADMQLYTTTGGGIYIDAVDPVEINSSGGAISIGNDAVTQAINIGTGAAARALLIGNESGATSVAVRAGTGLAYFAANATDHTTHVGSSTGVSQTVIYGGTGGAGIISTGSIQLDAQGVTNFILNDLGTDTSATAFRVRNNTTTTLFEVNGAGDIDASDGTLDVPAGTSFKINGTALTTANFTAPNVDDLLDGSNADSLHTHSNVGASNLNAPFTDSGSGLAAGAIVYFSGASTVAAADADAIATGRAVGWAPSAVTASASGTINFGGLVTNATSSGGAFTIGSPVYLSGTAGQVTPTAPSGAGTVVMELGIAYTTTAFMWQPKAPIVNT